jgi:phosphonate transport system permease protein
MGFLTRVFIEVIDETSASSVEALCATGATRAQVIFQAVLPDIAPQAISWVLFTLETNVRSATLVGMLTGTGIGFLFTLYYRYMDYKSASLVVIGIVVVVLIIEALSNAARKVVL